MNLRTTLALFVLAAAGGAVLWFGASLPNALDPIPKAPPPADAGSRAILDYIDPETLTFIRIAPADRPAVELRRSDAGWAVPGNWPVNPDPVKELTKLLGGLRPRFEPEPAADLSKYGLDHPAVTVHLTTTGGEHTLAFGRRSAEAGDPFTQETYVRVDDKPEVLRLGPGLIDELDRPADAYQQRRLFPKERTAKSAEGQEKGERLEGKSLTVTDKAQGGSIYSLDRGADGWELSAPRATVWNCARATPCWPPCRTCGPSASSPTTSARPPPPPPYPTAACPAWSPASSGPASTNPTGRRNGSWSGPASPRPNAPSASRATTARPSNC